MARRETTDSIEGALLLEKYENARKTDNGPEMTKFLESVSTQANPDTDDQPSQLELGYASKPQGRVNDSSLSKVKNMFNTAVATTGKGKAGLDPKDLTGDEDPEKSGRKLSSKMTKLKKFFSKDDKVVTTSVPASAEKMLVVLKAPRSSLMKIANLQELPQMVQNVNSAEHKITLQRVAGEDDQGGDGPREPSEKKAVEEGKSDLEEKSTATYSSAEDANREKAPTSDSLGGPMSSVKHKSAFHLNPANSDEPFPPHRKRATASYDDQGFLTGESGKDVADDRKLSAERRLKPLPLREVYDYDSEEESMQNPKYKSSGEEVLPSLAVAHYTPSLQKIATDPVQAMKQYEHALTYVKLRETRKLAEKEREKAFAESSQGSSHQGALPSTPSLEELKRQEAEASRNLEEIQRDKRKQIDHWADNLDPPRQVLSAAQRQRTGFESKERKSSSSSSTSRERQRMRYQFATPSTESRGSRKVEVLSTIAEDDLEVEDESPKSQSPELLHPRPLSASRRRPSFLPKSAEASPSPQRDAVGKPSSQSDQTPTDNTQGSSGPTETSSPSTPKAQPAQQLGAREQIDRMIEDMQNAGDGKSVYNEYEAASDITVGLSPDTHMEMYPPPLHIIKKPKMKDTYSSTPGYYGYPPRGSQMMIQGPRPLPQLPQSSQDDSHSDSSGFSSAQQARLIVTVGGAISLALDHINRLEDEVKELKERVQSMRGIQDGILEKVHESLTRQTGEEEHAEDAVGEDDVEEDDVDEDGAEEDDSDGMF